MTQYEIHLNKMSRKYDVRHQLALGHHYVEGFETREAAKAFMAAAYPDAVYTVPVIVEWQQRRRARRLALRRAAERRMTAGQ